MYHRAFPILHWIASSLSLLHCSVPFRGYSQGCYRWVVAALQAKPGAAGGRIRRLVLHVYPMRPKKAKWWLRSRWKAYTWFSRKLFALYKIRTKKVCRNKQFCLWNMQIFFISHILYSRKIQHNIIGPFISYHTNP